MTFHLDYSESAFREMVANGYGGEHDPLGLVDKIDIEAVENDLLKVMHSHIRRAIFADGRDPFNPMKMEG